MASRLSAVREYLPVEVSPWTVRSLRVRIELFSIKPAILSRFVDLPVMVCLSVPPAPGTKVRTYSTAKISLNAAKSPEFNAAR